MIFPVPKPEPRVKKAKKPVKRENYARQKKDWPRAFGSIERALFVKALPCAWCQRLGCENAHTENEGRSRRGHYLTIVPLCADWLTESGLVMGCHKRFDRHLAPFDNEESRQQVRACAPEVQRLWLERSAA